PPHRHGLRAAYWRQRQEEGVLAQRGLGGDLDGADEATHPGLQLHAPGGALGVGHSSQGQ
ncbi:hypothetical protein P7K49_015360, partial [Saguinus oedipus]